MNYVILGLVITLGFGANTWAEDDNSTSGQTTVELSDIKPAEESKDNQITNAKLAAEAGSKSKVSMRLNLSYSGGSIEKPFDRIRPNYRGTPGTLVSTSLGGSIAAAYRIDQLSSLRFGTGLSMRTPLHNTWNEVQSNETTLANGTKQRVFNVSTPYLEYNRTFRSGSIMYSPSVAYYHSTDQHATDIVGSVGSASASLTAIFDLEGSSWQPGVSVSLFQGFYKDNNMYDSAGDARANLGGGLYPFVEYAFSDVWSFRTVFGYFNYTNYRHQAATEFETDSIYQSVGIGYAPKQGVYLYPNIQFVPDRLSLQETNVGLTTILNIF